jgi:hypothetical protein
VAASSGACAVFERSKLPRGFRDSQIFCDHVTAESEISDIPPAFGDGRADRIGVF